MCGHVIHITANPQQSSPVNNAINFPLLTKAKGSRELNFEICKLPQLNI
jgi:hypothetical protein